MSEKKIPVWLSNGIDQIEIYRRPNLAAVEANLDPILKALHGVTLEHCEIENLKIYDEYLLVNLGWVSRGCEECEEFKVPLSVINDPEPVLAAKVHRVRTRISELETRHASLLRQAEFVGADIQALTKDLSEILKQSVDKPS